MSDAGVPAEPAKPTAMLPREQQFGYALAALGVVSGVVWAVTGAGLLGLLGAAAGVLLGLAVRHGQRVITCFAALLAGFLLGGYLPLEVLFLAYSGWLMLRVSKAQGQLRAAQPRRTSGQRREAKVARSRPGGDGTTGPGPRQPTANRRYTPPRSKPGSKR